MAKGNHKSQEISVFHERILPEEGVLAGYGAIIDALKLPVVIPKRLSLISTARRQYQTDDWQVFTPRHQPPNTIYGQLVFALKYEGINLLVLKKLFERIQPAKVEEWIHAEPLGQYCRRIWFLYEWLMDTQLDVPDLKSGNYVLLVDEEMQYGNPVSENISRQRIKNNLPGNKSFCPLINKTPRLEKFISENLSGKTEEVIGRIRRDILMRTSSFLLLKDSKASFNIEGETPPASRTMRWGRAIGEAGNNKLTKDELFRLQQIIIGDSRFVKMGYRTEGGFVGEHDRLTLAPIPEHISARQQDIEQLMSGLLLAAEMLVESGFNPVLTAAVIAFGFVFIHPFTDGNGRMHRYLIHHVLSATKFTPEGIIFPVSAAILDKIGSYQKILESYSHPLLDLIDWEKTPDNNIEVTNDTIDYYRYFDATAQADFLFACIEDTIDRVIPVEAAYIQRYDQMKNWIDEKFSMPDKTSALLIRFLEQNNGTLSKRAREDEFAPLTDEEVTAIEKQFAMCFPAVEG